MRFLGSLWVSWMYERSRKWVNWLIQRTQSHTWRQEEVSPTRLGKKSSARKEKKVMDSERPQTSPSKGSSQYSGLTVILLSPPWECLTIFPQKAIHEKTELNPSDLAQKTLLGISLCIDYALSRDETWMAGETIPLLSSHWLLPTPKLCHIHVDCGTGTCLLRFLLGPHTSPV